MAKQKTLKGKALPVEWHIPDGIPIRYATNMVVQKLENEYLLSFFEIRPPLILGTPEQISVKLEGLKSITANCVAQIFIAQNKMPEFVKALNSVIIDAEKEAKE